MARVEMVVEPVPLPKHLEDEPPMIIPELEGSKFEDEVPITIVPRSGWGARPPLSEEPMSLPIVKIKFSSEDLYGYDPYTSRALRKMQNHYIDNAYESDVPFSFLVDEGGLIYEGRGWNVFPRYRGLEGESVLEIAFVGEYSAKYHGPSFDKCDAALSLILKGVREDKIDPKYKTVGLKDKNTFSPRELEWLPGYDREFIVHKPPSNN